LLWLPVIDPAAFLFSGKNTKQEVEIFFDKSIEKCNKLKMIFTFIEIHIDKIKLSCMMVLKIQNCFAVG
jgi:hypothetical protein